MAKAILVSILFAHVVLPTLAAGSSDAGRGLRRTVAYTVGFNLLYLLALTIVYPHL
ncbi:MAG: hypothetical protein HY901_09700 [Deltaproteobacteria bacterium]|nr:hypothetical protein [Deltaproteobacteria bacterium]